MGVQPSIEVYIKIGEEISETVELICQSDPEALMGTWSKDIMLTPEDPIKQGWHPLIVFGKDNNKDPDLKAFLKFILIYLK